MLQDTVVETLYWLPYCSTCQKAEAFLKDRQIPIRQSIDVKTTRLEKNCLVQLSEKLGGVENLFSKRALKYRAMGLHLRTLSEQEMLDLMQQEYTFIKRPVIVTSKGKALAGFSKKQYEAFFIT